MGILRIKMKGRETVFERSVNKKDVKETAIGHMQMFGRETLTVNGKPVQREVPKDIWEFFWVENPGPGESVEPVAIIG